MADDIDPLDERGATRVVTELLTRGQISAPVQLLRSGSNHVFRAGDVVVRISGADRDVTVLIRLLRLLADSGVPVLRAVDDLGLVAGARVSLWEYVVPGRDTGIDFAALGRAVAHLHAVAPDRLAGVHLPWFGDAGWLRLEVNLDRAAGTGILSDEEVAALRRVCEEIRGWDRPEPGEPVVVCHGDLHPANVLMRDGLPVLIDWDMVCLGPAAWDHAALMTWPERWGGGARDYSDFAAGYGADLSSDPVARRLARVRLLGPTINMVVLGASSERHRAEARRRLRYWMGDPDAPAWTPQ